MAEKSVGFIGGGRIVRIMLQALKRAASLPQSVIVSDTNLDAIAAFPAVFPGVSAAHNDNRRAAGQDIVFLAVHPPVVTEVLAEIRDSLRPDALLISLAPNPSIKKMEELLRGFNHIVRMLPNAPSLINSGFNPVVFSPAISAENKTWLQEMFGLFGSSPEVPEDKLPAYAILSMLGPTYFLFQLHELHRLAESFGLTHQEIQDTMFGMVSGTLKTLYMSHLPAERVMDLTPLKPLADMEESVKEAYRNRLSAAYNSLKQP
ncbi:MAG TPA: NAD(P)-binding domain-containing protein [Dissulfurispiraceae bacterium]|nr:NAD(P)-binding domain-containing protein [Dissulfurispiraceae bacterium]